MTAKKFTEDYLPLKDDLYKVAFYILESEPDAEDAVQDLYLKLWNAGDALDTIRLPKAYCISLLRNICIDRLRRHRPEGEDKIPMLPAEETPQDERLCEQEKVKAALKQMSTLSENERTVLKMKVFDDLSYEEIQKKTGLSYLSMRVHLSNARRKIKKAIERI